jgi:DNA repair protein RadC
MLQDASPGLFALDALEPRPQAARPKAYQLGHRERLRRRAHISPEALPDYEVLELMLCRTIPRGDVKPLAKALLERFGGLAGALAAPMADIKAVPGAGEAVALDLKLIHQAALRIGRDAVSKRPLISSWSALLAYTKTQLAHEPREQFRVLFLDKKNRLIADEQLGQGTVDHAPVYPREVARRALELSSSAVILVHNHPTQGTFVPQDHGLNRMNPLNNLPL